MNSAMYNIELIIATLRRHGPFAYGSEDRINQIAQEWHSHDFTDQGVDNWLNTGCFCAAAASDLSDAGVTHRQAASYYKDSGYSVGYMVANSDLSVVEAVEYLNGKNA